MKIPFVDLYAQYLTIKNEIDSSIENVIKNSAFIKGKYVREFEEAFASKLGIKNCIGVANGTDAIFITLKMLGLGEGDEVITTCHSWISTTETISLTRAKPVFVDTDAESFTINADLIENKISKKTKAIIPVHLYGHPAELNKILNIAEKYNLHVIEDCAQSHFSKYNGRFLGTFGIAATFSFFPGKNLGAYGDAGAVVTNDDTLAEKIRMYANHGQKRKHEHHMEGVNSRLDGIQAAILSIKLKYIEEWNEKRVVNAKYYCEKLAGQNKISLPKLKNNVYHTYHVYCVLAENRDKLHDYLESKGIETSVHYPRILPNIPVYKNLDEASYPVASKYQKYILSLPMFPELTFEQIDYVVACINEFYQS